MGPPYTEKKSHHRRLNSDLKHPGLSGGILPPVSNGLIDPDDPLDQHFKDVLPTIQAVKRNGFRGLAISRVKNGSVNSPMLGRKGVAFDWKPQGNGHTLQKKLIPINQFISKENVLAAINPNGLLALPQIQSQQATSPSAADNGHL